MKPWADRARDSDPAYELGPHGKTLLQARLATYGLVVFLIAVSYWPGFFLIWRAHPGLDDEIVLGHVLSPWTFALLALHGSLWLVCRAKPLPRAWLPAIDVVYHTGVGLVFGGIVRHHPSLTVANTVLGTPLYMAPEAFANPQAVDARSDLYSLGALAYLLLTGTTVFSGATAMEVAAAHIYTAPESLSARLGRPVPPELEALVLSCLAKAPSDRPESVRALRAELDACADAGKWHESDAEAWWDTRASRIEARHQSRAQGNSRPGRTLLIDLTSAAPRSDAQALHKAVSPPTSS